MTDLAATGRPWRCFWAVPLPDGLRASLAEAVTLMRADPTAEADWRWTDPGGLASDHGLPGRGPRRSHSRPGGSGFGGGRETFSRSRLPPRVWAHSRRAVAHASSGTASAILSGGCDRSPTWSPSGVGHRGGSVPRTRHAGTRSGQARRAASSPAAGRAAGVDRWRWARDALSQPPRPRASALRGPRRGAAGSRRGGGCPMSDPLAARPSAACRRDR